MLLSKHQKKFNQLMKDLKLDDNDPVELRNRFKYIPKEDKPIDWSTYNQAQIMEINNTLVMIRNMAEEAYQRVRHIAEPRNKVGAPFKKPMEDRAKAIMLQVFFGVSDKVAEGLIVLFREKLDITEYITAKDIERAYENKYVVAIIQEVFDMTNEPVGDKETEFSIDGTGDSTSIKRNWENDKGDNKKVKMFERVIGVVGVNTLMFSAVEIADEPQDNESPYLKDLVIETAGKYERIDYVYADAMFIARHNCDIIESIGAKPRIYPKENLTLKSDGSFAWARMLMEFVRNPQKWLREYHMRSNSESANSVWKRLFKKPLNRLKSYNRKFECFVRATVYNIRRLSYLYYLWGLSVPWLKG